MINVNDKNVSFGNRPRIGLRTTNITRLHERAPAMIADVRKQISVRSKGGNDRGFKIERK